MLTSAALKVSEIVSGPFMLDVPAYQRPYSWGEVQVSQLLEDLLEASGITDSRPPEDSYFLGAILLMDTPGIKTAQLSPKISPRVFDIVDGQQRLATLFMLFCALRDIETSSRKPIGRRLQSVITAQQGSRFRRSERNRLKLGQIDNVLFEDIVLTDASTRQQAVLDGLSPSEQAIVKMRDLIVSTLEDLSEEDRVRLFDFVMNRCNFVVIVSQDIDHAHRMFVVLNERGKQLQRDDIIKADVLRRAAPADANWIAGVWDQTGARLGGDFEQFFSHVRNIHGQDNTRIVTGVRFVIDNAGGALPFIKNVFEPLAESYHTIRTAGAPGMPEEMRLRLKYLNRLSDGDWAPAAMLALMDWQRNPDRAARLLAEIDRIAHLTRLSCAGAGKRGRRFAPIVAAIRSGEANDESHPVFTVARDEVRAINFHMKDLHKRGPKICKLVLMRLSDIISGRFEDVDPEPYTIEHILPQRAATTSEWRKLFPIAEERSHSVDSLGNLVLVSQKQNERARNGSFAEKKAIYADAAGGLPVLPITSDVFSVENWTRDEINRREARLIGMISELFRIDLVPPAPPSPKKPAKQAQPTSAPANRRAVPAGSTG